MIRATCPTYRILRVVVVNMYALWSFFFFFLISSLLNTSNLLYTQTSSQDPVSEYQ